MLNKEEFPWRKSSVSKEFRSRGSTWYPIHHKRVKWLRCPTLRIDFFDKMCDLWVPNPKSQVLLIAFKEERISILHCVGTECQNIVEGQRGSKWRSFSHTSCLCRGQVATCQDGCMNGGSYSHRARIPTKHLVAGPALDDLGFHHQPPKAMGGCYPTRLSGASFQSIFCLIGARSIQDHVLTLGKDRYKFWIECGRSYNQKPDFSRSPEGILGQVDSPSPTGVNGMSTTTVSEARKWGTLLGGRGGRGFLRVILKGVGEGDSLLQNLGQGALLWLHASGLCGREERAHEQVRMHACGQSWSTHGGTSTWKSG
eukprot:Gb_25303 [translate_table: standard]